MNKMISVMLVLLMVLSLAACGSSPAASGDSNNTADKADAGQKTEAEAGETQNGGAEGDKQEAADSIQADTVFAENEIFRMTFKGIESSEPFYTVKIGFENTSSEKTGYTDRVSNLAVNDFLLIDPDSFIHITGEDQDYELRLFKSDLEAIGIDSVDKIEKIAFSVGAYPNNKSLTKYECQIYPTGLDESSYVRKGRDAMPGDVLVGETDQVRLTAYWREGFDFVSCFKDECLHRPVLIIENTSGKDNLYAWEGFAINGIELPDHYTGYSASLKAGETAVIPMIKSIEDISGLEEYNITKAEEVSFMLMIRHGDTAANASEVWYKCVMDQSDLHE